MFIALIDEYHDEVPNSRKNMNNLKFKITYLSHDSILVENRLIKWDWHGPRTQIVGFGFYQNKDSTDPSVYIGLNTNVPPVSSGDSFIVPDGYIKFHVVRVPFDITPLPAPKLKPKPSRGRKRHGRILD